MGLLSINLILKLAQIINPQVKTYHPFKVNLEELRQFPEGTLGYEIARYLDQNDFDPIQSGDFIQRTHDVWHVLTGLSASPEEELMLQAFTRAQVFRPSCIVIILLGLITGKCRLSQIVKSYQAGRLAKRLMDWNIESDLAAPLAVVRQKLGITPLLRIKN